MGTCREVLNYDAVGTLADYMAIQKNAYAFTIELDPPNDGISGGFNLPETQIRTVFERNIRGALGFIAAAGIDLEMKCCSTHTIKTTSVNKFVGWNVFGRGNQLPL